MWKWILGAALLGLALFILWPFLFPPETPTSVVNPVNSNTGSGWGYTDAAGNQITAYGSSTVQITQGATNTGIAAPGAALIPVNKS